MSTLIRSSCFCAHNYVTHMHVHTHTHTRTTPFIPCLSLLTLCLLFCFFFLFFFGGGGLFIYYALSGLLSHLSLEPEWFCLIRFGCKPGLTYIISRTPCNIILFYFRYDTPDGSEDSGLVLNEKPLPSPGDGRGKALERN